jgi:hypothetical protein
MLVSSLLFTVVFVPFLFCQTKVIIKQMDTTTIHIEALDTSLHGARILCQGPFCDKKLPPIMESIQRLRDPFKKRILMTNATLGLSKYAPLHYDAIFQARDSADWTLALTYATYAPKPLLIMIEDVKIPEGLWQKIGKGMTLVHITASPVLHLRPYDAIFFAPVEDFGTPFVDYIFKALQSVFRATYSQKEHKEILQELRVAGAGIAWTKVEEEMGNGSIYWYDPVQQGERMEKGQMADLMMYLADGLRS